MEYKLVFGSMLATVEDEVNAAMKDGWQAHGSLVCESSRYIQPMIRHEADTEIRMWTGSYAYATEAE